VAHRLKHIETVQFGKSGRSDWIGIGGNIPTDIHKHIEHLALEIPCSANWLLSESKTY